MAMAMAPDFHSVIKERLAALRWTDYRLTRELEGRIPASTVYAYLRGRIDIPSRRLATILDVLGIQVCYYANAKETL